MAPDLFAFASAVVPLKNLPQLEFAQFRAALLEEIADNARIASFFGRPTPAGLELFAVLAHDWQGELALLRTCIGDSYPALTPECPQLHLFERELAEQFGVLPEGHPWLKPVRFHRSWVECADIWGRDSRQHPIPGD
ncbi:MAG: NADH-quinone oxidoreductase subunit C, partial [Deltaproteobacteria bacterium]|nr:NADH-quinone oxidoreductase subunit C [Deltaproteobacteria bacterium]